MSQILPLPQSYKNPTKPESAIFTEPSIIKEIESAIETPDDLTVAYQQFSQKNPDTLPAAITRAAQQSDLERLAAYAPSTRNALQAMQTQALDEDYAEWLKGHLDDMEVAQEAADSMRVAFVPTRPVPIARFVKQSAPRIPLYDLWLRRMKTRPQPARAKAYLPVVKAAFAAEGLPEQLVWLAEAESTFNPRARSPIGARGLFQLMPETAKSLGITADQRTQPAKSARAAAVYLKRLHVRFGDWPLALAAYNGGESRVARLLKERRAKDFAGIAAFLPAETRLYVPKVLATVHVRTGYAPSDLPSPKGLRL